MEQVAASSSSSESNLPTDVYKYNNFQYHWTKSIILSNSSWAQKSQDVQALKLALDSRIWFPREGRTEDYDSTSSYFLQEDPKLKKSGIELYVGHLEDNRRVLLFSFESIQRCAQKLHESGKTSRVMPLPPSLPEKEKAAVIRFERCFVTTSNELRDLQRKVEKQNKLISHEESMSQWGKEYEEVRRIWSSTEVHSTFIGFDVETHEVGHQDILEVGWSIVGSNQEQETFHYLIEESYVDGLRNGRYVADNRRNFLFGKVREIPLVGSFPKWTANGTEIATTMDVGRRFAKTLRQCRRKGPVYVVFHDSKGDLKVMDELGINTEGWSYTLLGKKEAKKAARQTTNPNGDLLLSTLVDQDDEDEDVIEKKKALYPVYILDTQLLFAALRCGGVGEKRSLQYICTGLDVNGGVLNAFHNAANDAHYTAAALAKMAEGPHFTVMRGMAEARIASNEEKNKSSTEHANRGGQRKQKQSWS